VGYYRLYSQLQLVQTPTSGLSLGFQGVTPAGMESDGLATGPTVISPALSWYQELDPDTAIQGFVGKHLHANTHCFSGLGHSVQCGVAVQRPLPDLPVTGMGKMYMFVEALGHYRYETNLSVSPTASGPTGGPAAMWEVVPGVHWRVGDNWWLSGGVRVPVGPAHPEAGLWQITCSFQF
jgi:hypothetical protein